MAQKKFVPIAGVLIVVLIALAGVYLFTQSEGDVVEVQSEDVSDISQEEPDLAENEQESPDLLKERVLGDPNAPVKIIEYSSFTCGHCGNFHQNTFKQFKAEWIDTGKAYLVFSDFPLNGPALHASMAARCVAEDRYFDFVQELFETQNDWATGTGYMEKLKSTAAEYGVSGDEFTACVQDKDVQQAILGRMRAAQAQFEITSTPSFVINNETMVSGAMAYDVFDAAIKEALTPVPIPLENGTGNRGWAKDESDMESAADIGEENAEGDDASEETQETPEISDSEEEATP